MLEKEPKRAWESITNQKERNQKNQGERRTNLFLQHPGEIIDRIPIQHVVQLVVGS